MVSFPFYRDRATSQLVRTRFDSIVRTLLRAQFIAPETSRLQLELLLADEFAILDDLIRELLRRARDDGDDR
jgi:hypothetical protein